MTDDQILEIAKQFGPANELLPLLRAIAAEQREEDAAIAEHVVPRHTECGNKIAAAIRKGEK